MKQWLTAGLAMTVLAGCGAPAGVRTVADKPLKAASEAPMFPATPGHTWQYKVVAHPADDPYVDYAGTETVEVESVRREGAATVVAMRAIDSFTTRYRYPVVTMTSDKVVLSDVEYLGVAADSVEGHAIDFLRLPLKPGTKWDDGLWVGEAKGQETVTVGAGTFRAYKVGAIGTHAQAYTAVGNYWVAPGVGIVKSELNIPGWIVESELQSSR